MSWFWYFGKKVLNSGWFNQYLDVYNPSYTKWDQIKNYEMKFPLSFKQRGMRVGAYTSADDVFEVANKAGRSCGRKDFTMTHLYWDLLIKDFRCPGLKVELVRDNPLGIDTSKVFQYVRDFTDYDPELIRAHLRRMRTIGRIPSQDHPRG